MRWLEIISIAGMLLFAACTTNPENPQVPCERITLPASNEEAISLFTQTTKLKPVNCTLYISGGDTSILCIADTTTAQGGSEVSFMSHVYDYYRLTSVSGCWKVTKRHPLLDSKDGYVDFEKGFEVVKIGGQTWLYYLFRTGGWGNATPFSTLHFTLLNIGDHNSLQLEYGGDPVYMPGEDTMSYIRGEVMENDILSQYPAQEKWLKAKMDSCPVIYKLTARDLDPMDPINAEQKWKTDNPDAFGAKPGETFSIAITYYDSVLFYPENQASRTRLENDDFIIEAYFRGSILCYDKLRRQYFPLWADDCSHGCDKDIVLLDGNMLEIRIEGMRDEGYYTVDMNEMTGYWTP